MLPTVDTFMAPVDKPAALLNCLVVWTLSLEIPEISSSNFRVSSTRRSVTLPFVVRLTLFLWDHDTSKRKILSSRFAGGSATFIVTFYYFSYIFIITLFNFFLVLIRTFPGYRSRLKRCCNRRRWSRESVASFFSTPALWDFYFAACSLLPPPRWRRSNPARPSLAEANRLRHFRFFRLDCRNWNIEERYRKSRIQIWLGTR